MKRDLISSSSPESFVPHKDEKDGGEPPPVVRTLNPCFGGARPKHSERANDLHQGPLMPTKPQSTVFKDAAPPVFHLQNANAPSSRNISSEHNIVSIMEKQNEITSMLVQQQSLASLPKRDIQIFDGNPLQFHAFMQSFEQTIEQRAANGVDCLHYLN